MAKAEISKAGRVQPGDRIVCNGDGPVFVSRVTKMQGRKPPRGENLCILGYDSVTARKAQRIQINSEDRVKILARPLATT